jgi:hypothetical protein
MILSTEAGVGKKEAVLYGMLIIEKGHAWRTMFWKFLEVFR